MLLPVEDYVYQFEVGKFLPLLAIAALLIPVQTLIEELLFRGHRTQLISLRTKLKWIPLVIVALLFTVVHTANPEFQAGFWRVVPIYFIFSLIWGLVAILDDGLELSWGMHAANNIFTAVILSTSDGAMNTDSIFQTKVENLIEILPILLAVLSVVSFLFFYIKYQWRFRSLFEKID